MYTLLYPGMRGMMGYIPPYYPGMRGMLGYVHPYHTRVVHHLGYTPLLHLPGYTRPHVQPVLHGYVATAVLG